MLTQAIAQFNLTSDDDGRGSGRVAFAPVCGQCKHFDVHRKLCGAKTEYWENKLVRPKAQANNPACSDRFIESAPF